MSAVDAALAHADWWTGDSPRQTDMLTTDAMRVLALEVRRLRGIESAARECAWWHASQASRHITDERLAIVLGLARVTA